MRYEQPHPLIRNKVCPKCGKHGFLTRRWVRASRYPKYSSLICMEVEAKRKELARDPDNKELQVWIERFGSQISGNRYWGMVRRNSLADNISRREFKGQNFFRVESRKYYCYYFGHYDAKKFQQQMVDYRSGKRNSRPNGRRWCKASVGINDHRRDTWP